LMRYSSAPQCGSRAWEHVMRRLDRNCLSHSSVAISETCGRHGAIQNLMTPAGAQAMAGGFLTPGKQLGNLKRPPKPVPDALQVSGLATLLGR